MKELKDLSLTELLLLHNNHCLVLNNVIGCNVSLLTSSMFTAVCQEIRLRLADVSFKNTQQIYK